MMIQMHDLCSTQDIKFGIRQTPIQLSGTCNIEGNFEVYGDVFLGNFLLTVTGHVAIVGNVSANPYALIYDNITAKKIFIDGNLILPLCTLEAEEIEITGTCTCRSINAKYFKCSQYTFVDCLP